MGKGKSKKIGTPSTPTKEELELQKLLLEIKQLNDPWWKKPTYVLAALPTVLAICTLLVGIFTGYFQATAVKLENQKYALETDIKQFASQKHELHRENQRLLAEREDLNLKIEETRKNLEDMKHMIYRLQDRQDAFIDKRQVPNRYNIRTATLY